MIIFTIFVLKKGKKFVSFLTALLEKGEFNKMFIG